MIELAERPETDVDLMLSFPLLSPQECEDVLRVAASCAQLEPLSGDALEVHAAKANGPRNTSKIALPEIEPWLRLRLQEAFNLGARHFGYDGVPRLHETRRQCSARVATYRVGGEFSWHLDIANPFNCYPAPRIHWLACSILLTTDYTGGDLEMAPHLKGLATRGLGDCTVFMGWHPHRVAPVTAGCRQALVCWGEIPVEPAPESLSEWKARMASLGKAATVSKPGPCTLDRFA